MILLAAISIITPKLTLLALALLVVSRSAGRICNDI